MAWPPVTHQDVQDAVGTVRNAVTSGPTAPANGTIPMWVDTSTATPVLNVWENGTWTPSGGNGARRTPQYWIPAASGATPGEVRLTDVPQFGGSIRVETDGDVPGPLTLVIYRAGTYNRCEGTSTPLSGGPWWQIGNLTDNSPTGWAAFTVFVDGNGANAALVFRSYATFGRHVRVYWSEV